MNINKNVFATIEKYTLIFSLLFYLICIFILKSMPFALPFIFSACFINLFHQKFYSCRLKLAALNHLIPVAVMIASRFSLLEQLASGKNLVHTFIILSFSMVPFLLLLSGKTIEKPSKKKTILVVKVRILVQVTIFTAYATFSAYAWILGSKAELFFWGLTNVLTVAILPFICGRALCGWICPNATMQDGLYKNLTFARLINKLPKSIEEQSHTCGMNISGEIDKNAPYLPFTLLLSWCWLFLVEMLFDLTTYNWYPTALLYGLFTFSLLLPWRKFCTYFCPLSGNRCMAGQNSIWRIKFNKQNCRNCNICAAERACPFNIDITNQETEMPATCCLCFNCMDACPYNDVITIKRQKNIQAAPK